MNCGIMRNENWDDVTSTSNDFFHFILVRRLYFVKSILVYPCGELLHITVSAEINFWHFFFEFFSGKKW